MADLEKVLRTFALQKMQELRDKQGNEMEPAQNNHSGAEETKQSKAEPEQGDGQHIAGSVTSGKVVFGDGKQASKPPSELLKTKVDDKSTRESIVAKPDPAKETKDKKITIRLLTKKIEPEPTRPKDEKEVVAEEDEEDNSSSDSSDSEDEEAEVKDGKPWRQVYEEGELSPSSDSEADEDEDTEVNAAQEDNQMDTGSSGEIKEDLKKSKKHKKHKHKKHKHHKDKARDSDSPRDKHKDRSKKDKKKDKEKKEKAKDREKTKTKDKDKNKDKLKKDKKKSKDGSELDESDSGTDTHKEKSEKKDRKHKSKHKDKGAGSGESKKASKRKHKSGSRSWSRSPSRSRSSTHKRQKHSRSRSRSPKSHRRGESSRSRYYRNDSPDRFHTRHYTASSSRYRKRSRSRSPHSEDEFKIDKAKLLEIAKANAYAKMQSGELPPYMKITPKSIVTKVEPKERSSVEELTAVCKEIASKQQDYSDSDDSPVNRPVGSDEENDEPFIRHPFKVREAPLGSVGIVMNIKNAVQKPIQDKEMLRLTFPVSSGSQHRKKEDETGLKPYGDWVSVERKPNMMDPVAKPTTKLMPIPGTTTMTTTGAVATAAESPGAGSAATADAAAAVAATAAMPPPPAPPPTNSTAQAVTPAPPPAPLTFAGIISPAGALPTSSAIAAASMIPAAAAAAEFASAVAAAAVAKVAAAAQAPAPVTVAATPPIVQTEPPKEDKVFEEVTTQNVDIGAMVSARLKAARRLECNPNDVEALSVMHKAQTQIRNWTVGKQKPGMFTGDTGLRTLRPEELANTDPRAQAWAKRDMFHNQTPLRGGNKGAMLMAKMGWRQGEGLGKNNEGVLEPLALDVKTDRKGLVAGDEQRRKKNQVPKAVFKDLSGKHPVSALMEICNKRRWSPPSFDLVQDKGPAHKKNFIFKVRINNEEYQPSVSCPNKKQAKAQAAAVALQKMGLIPPDQPV